MNAWNSKKIEKLWNPEKAVPAEINAHQKQWFFKGGSAQNRRVLMGDFSKGGVHKTDGFWWMIFQRGECTKPTGFGMFLIASKN